MLEHLINFRYATGILIDALKASDEDEAHTAVSVMLSQLLQAFSGNEVVITQFFPVLDRLQRLIEQSQLEAALNQATKFDLQLSEIIGMISSPQ